MTAADETISTVTGAQLQHEIDSIPGLAAASSTPVTATAPASGPVDAAMPLDHPAAQAEPAAVAAAISPLPATNSAGTEAGASGDQQRDVPDLNGQLAASQLAPVPANPAADAALDPALAAISAPARGDPAASADSDASSLRVKVERLEDSRLSGDSELAQGNGLPAAPPSPASASLPTATASASTSAAPTPVSATFPVSASASTSTSTQPPQKARSSSAASTSGSRSRRPPAGSSSSKDKGKERESAIPETPDDGPSASTSARPSRRSGNASGRSKGSATPAGPGDKPSPAAASGGTARTRELAQKQIEKEKERDRAKAKRASRCGRKGSSSSSDEDDGDRGQQDGSDAEAETEAAAAEEPTKPTKKSQSNGSKKGGASAAPAAVPAASSTAATGAAAGDEDVDEGITRCVCGNNEDDAPGFMIQCETCRAWQHGPCMGFKEESKCPDVYFCDQCRPDLHPNLAVPPPPPPKQAVSKKSHARSASTSGKGKAGQQADSSAANGETISHTLAKPESRGNSRPPNSRDRESSASMPPSATALHHSLSHSHSSSHSQSHHRPRASADASIIQSFLDTKKGSPSPTPSVGSPREGPPSASSQHGGTVPLAADGKRPMYPATSHLSAPLLPKRRSTMNSRDSAAFDESIMLANVNAFKESRLMAAGAGHSGGEGSSGNRRKRRRKGSTDGEEEEDDDDDHPHGGSDGKSRDESMSAVGNSSLMEIVKEEEEEDDGTAARPQYSALHAQSKSKRRRRGNTEAAKDKTREGSAVPESAKPPASSVTGTNGSPAPQGDADVADENEGEEGDHANADSSAVANAKKRRKRRGPGATAPVRKKTPAKPQKSARAGSAAISNTGGDDTEDPPVTPVQLEVPAFETAEPYTVGLIQLASTEPRDAPTSSKKRKAASAGDSSTLPANVDQSSATTIPALPALDTSKIDKSRPASPTVSTPATESSHASSDKPLAVQIALDASAGPGNSTKKRKTSPTPSAAALHAAGIGRQGDVSAQNIEVAAAESTGAERDASPAALVPPSPSVPSNAPSPTGSAFAAAVASVAGKGKMSSLAPPSAAAAALARGKRAPKPQQGPEETEDDEATERSTTPAAFAAPSAPSIASTARGKHPNQYTYKPRGGAGARGGTGKSPSKRAGQGGAIDRRGRDRDDTPGGFEDLLHNPPSWHLPDHLSHLAHLLPSSTPQPLAVPSYPATPAASSAASPSDAPGGSTNAPTDAAAVSSHPGAEPVTATSSAASSSTGSNGTSIPVLPAAVKHLEPPAKVRFPPRRVSMSEMKKRAKHVLDYLSRVQMEMVERSNRNRALGLNQGYIKTAPIVEVATNGASAPNSHAGSSSASTAPELAQVPKSALMMDDLSRRLIGFQDKYV